MKIRAYLEERSSGSVLAWCPDLPGCSATGPDSSRALGVLVARIDEFFRAGQHETAPRGARKVELEYWRETP
jgi:hypothetical protein